MTTGPLGQGVSTAVGMAMAARFERGLFDPETTDGSSLFEHKVWVICSDGDLQEGVSSEAASLAGTQSLGSLNVIYDDNRISIEGDTHVAFTEDVSGRYRAYGWEVIEVSALPNGDVDLANLDKAMSTAGRNLQQPTLIRLKTVIAWPAPNAKGTSKSHGSTSLFLRNFYPMLVWLKNEVQQRTILGIRDLKHGKKASLNAQNFSPELWQMSYLLIGMPWSLTLKQERTLQLVKHLGM